MTRDPHDLEATYRGYDRSGRSDGRWSGANQGNRAIHAERNRRLEEALDRCAQVRPLERLLEVGCGGGALLEEIASMSPAARASCVGVDLLAFRLSAAHAVGRVLPVAQADGQSLPFADASFDVVVLSTVVSSVGEDVVLHRIVREVDRVLRPGGSAVWYDMRYPNPFNRHVRPVSRRRLSRLFAGYRAELSSVTLLPQIARRLGRLTEVGYPLLASVPPIRSHLVGRLTKQS